MNIYLIERPQGNPADWDHYIGGVVTAETEEDARHIHPGGKMYTDECQDGSYLWIKPEEVKVTVLGISLDTKSGVIMDSFNAG